MFPRRCRMFGCGLLIISVSVMCVLQLSTRPREYMRRLSSITAPVVGVLKNVSSTITGIVPVTYNVIRYVDTITDVITAPPEDRETNKSGRYVSMCAENLDKRRIGNQLFNFAAMLHVARLTGRRVVVLRRHPHGWLDRWFQVPVTRVDHIQRELYPCISVGERASLVYSSSTLSTLSNRTYIAGKNILICGFFQSWKYTLRVESALHYHLQLLPNVQAAVRNYLEQIRPPMWKGQSFSRVGIHVRAGDIMRRDKWVYGYTIPQRPYFVQAMSRFVNLQQERHAGRVQFIVTSDSLDWVKRSINFTSIAQHLNRTSFSTNNEVVVDVAHSEGHDSGFDLALLSVCDGVIMSTGTYGWWGAWLANKTTIYYSNWPRVGSPLRLLFKSDDFFPQKWIPMGGPEFPCCQA